MFTYRLSRLPYLVLLLAYYFWAISVIGPGENQRELLLTLATYPVFFVFVVLPRVRDCDWPLWIGLVLLVPYLAIIPSVALMFFPSKVLGRREKGKAEPGTLAPVIARQVVGSKCDGCGTKIVFSNDGVLIGDKVYCRKCDDKRMAGAESAAPSPVA